MTGPSIQTTYLQVTRKNPDGDRSELGILIVDPGERTQQRTRQIHRRLFHARGYFALKDTSSKYGMLPAHRLVELGTGVYKASSSVVSHAKRRYVPGLRRAESILPQRGVLEMSRSILHNHVTNEVSRRQVSALCPAVSSPPLNLVAGGRSRVGDLRSATIPSDLNASTHSDVMYVDSPRSDNIISFRRFLQYNLAASRYRQVTGSVGCPGG